MTTASLAADRSALRNRLRLRPTLAGAELLKLRKRRGLVAASLALTAAPMLVAYGVLALLHGSDPAEHGPAGGVENFAQTIEFLSRLVVVAAFLVGVTAGAGDHRAGVFRELVVTGCSRLALFAARIPGGLAFLIPAVAAALAITATASIALAGSHDAPSVALLVKASGWIALSAGASFALGLGLASLLGSATISIAVLLGWNFAVIPVLRVIDKLSGLRDGLLPVAIERLQPAGLVGPEAADSSLAVALVAIAGWTLIPLALGAWRTTTRDA
jgi:hypothetical protein